MKVCTAQQMRNLDRAAEELGGIPGIVLMENAALACVQEILKRKPKSVGIFCGKGNNGGDGLAIARHLKNRGIDTAVYFVCGTDYQGDALINYEIYTNMGGKSIELTRQTFFEYHNIRHDLLVDAIFGTGFSGEPRGIAGEVIEEINRLPIPVLSVDIPSGISADDGAAASAAVHADVTVTFAAYKRGLLLYPGADYAGEIILADISIPQYIMEQQNVTVSLLDRTTARELMPRRSAYSQKGDYGKILIIGGSKGMSGAVAMAAQSALKCGAGLILAGAPQSINPILEQKLTEPMTLSLPEQDGKLSRDAIPAILEKLSWCDSVLIGPGMGQSEDTAEILAQVFAKSSAPVVVDADALNLLSRHMDYLDACSAGLVLTPHSMEFSRISGLTLPEIEASRLTASEAFAQEHGVTLILKGPHTVITAPDGEQRINTTGNPGMASGGSGDVLAGMIAAFLARGLQEADAAALAVYLHGATGDLAARRLGEDSMSAMDLISEIPAAIKNLILPVENQHQI